MMRANKAHLSSFYSILIQLLHDISWKLSPSLLQMKHVLHPSRTQHNGDTGADVQQGPVQRFLFRLRPCVNLFYCLLLLTSSGYSTQPRRMLALLACVHARILHIPRHMWFLIKGIVQPGICYKHQTPQGVFGVASLDLYASALNHVFGQMLGLHSSHVLVPYVPLYRLRQHWENYCDCALVHPGEHLSRESRKLTVMIQQETGQPLDDSSESSGFLRINKGPFPGHVRTRPVFGRAQKYQGLYSSPTVKLLWLSESVKAIQSDCLVRCAIISLMDQDVGSSVDMHFLRTPPHYMRGG